MMRKLLYASTAAALVVGCSADMTGSDSSYATDSFQNPTDHGQLIMGEPVTGQLTASERFHAWRFSLTADASLSLETMNLSHNVDTVMYLYGTDADGEVTGSYLAKNDDHDGELASRVAEELAEGHYLVLVRAHKTQITGSFQLLGTCSGAGCPVPALPETFEEQCESIDEGVADCVYDGWTLEQCAPTEDGIALMCCNALYDNYCDVTCDGSSQELEGDVSIFTEYGDDWGGVSDAHGYVASVCGGATFDQVIAAGKSGYSDLLDQYEIDGGWGEGEMVDRSGLNSGILWASDGLVDEMDAMARDDYLQAWTARIEVPCQNCEQWIEKWVIFYPNTGAVFELEGTYGWD